MISVLLIILKIIGITLLVIIGLILLLLLLVLFVPVHYKAEGNYDDAFRYKAKVSWLLHLISVKVDVEEEVTTSVRILGIPLSVFMKKKKQPPEEEQQPDKKVSDKEAVDETKRSGEEQPASKTDGGAVVEETPESETCDVTVETSIGPSETDVEDKKSFFDKILDKIHGIIEKAKDIRSKIRNIFEKIKEFFINIEDKKKTVKRYLVILKSDTAKATFALCKKRLFIMLKHIFPRKMLVDITYGLEDPANTGYVLGVYGVLPVFIGERIVLHPDFEKQVFKCDFHMKGAICMWTLLYQLLRVIFDENCRKLFYIVKKEISNERK